MKRIYFVVLAMIFILVIACDSKSCDETQAYNKMLALNKVVGRMFSKGGEGLTKVAAFIQTESGVVSELIAQKKFTEACAKAEEIAGQYKINLADEMKDMVTFEQLAKDGGKGTGGCSIADAATRQMALHSLLQAEVDAGRKGTDIFSTFNQDTKSFAEMLSTDPTKACELIDQLKLKYGL